MRFPLWLLTILPILSGCASLGGSLFGPDSATGATLAEAVESVKPVAHDEPGTPPARLSPEVVAALAGASADASGFQPFADDTGASAGNVRLYRIEQALAVASTPYDRAWLLLEEGRLLASLDRCDVAVIRFRNLADETATPPAERRAARAELERIRRGVCWTPQKWDGYRYRPAPKYPPRKGVDWIEGDVELLLYVSPHGGVREAVVTRSSLKALEPYALNAAYRWRFEPFVVDGVRIPFVLRQTLQFHHPQILISEP
jgi:TonB family protein